MGRFSCFVPSLKQKKSAQPSFDQMMKTLQLDSHRHSSESAITDLTLHELPSVKTVVNNLGSGTEHLASTSRSCNSGELKCDSDAQSNADSLHYEKGSFRRSLSVGCELDQQRTFGFSNDDDCIVQESSYEGSHETAEGISPTNDAKSPQTSLPDQDREASHSMSPHSSSLLVNHESVFSADEAHYFNKGLQEDSHLSMYAECLDGSGQITHTESRISKCYSMPNFGSMSPKATGVSACDVLTRNRSFEDLNKLSLKKESISALNASAPDISCQIKEENFYHPEKLDGDNAGLDNYDSYSYGCSNKEWIIPMPDEIGLMRHDEWNSCDHWDDYTNKDFKIKQIEDWIIDLQHCSPVEETNEVSDAVHEVKRGTAFLDGVDKIEMRVNPNPGMEAAKRYISTLSASATTAQLGNFGLVAIPFLSAFVSLKALNLSGNSIVRITAGALPRGLHMLSLSKNKISIIEGLRELTRLRVLDLSYNKVSRIGHGLASCSTLKELYLAGNKISEVEGLHRLLKLTVLDLRFNKIATSKCLGLLAANYNSLQAISLEGNPAQKNVGDEQLKKYLQGLLPHLAYYNRQHTKTSTIKDSSDRSVRLGISDRGLRSDHKSSRRGATKRSSHSSMHGHKGQASDSLKHAKGKQVLVPPSGAKLGHRHHHFDVENKQLQSLRSGLSLHKSRSESTLAAL